MQHESSSTSSPLPDRVVGIDVSKAQLDCFIDPPPPSGSPSLRLANDPGAVAQLVAMLRPLGVRLVLIEATGRYHRRLAADLLEAQIPVAVVNPQRAREFARATGKLEKSDRIDAQVLAGFARATDHHACQKAPQNQAQLDDLVSRRRGLVQMRIAEKNRQHDQLPQLARSQCRQMLRLIEQQIEDLDRAIARMIDSDDDWRNKSELICSVPGVSQTTAHQLIADLPELGKLNRGKIAKLVGVAPLSCDSGRHQGQRRIQGGRGAVRTALYMAAFNAMRYCTRFRLWADQLARRGKPFKVIVTACMRKLLITLNRMVHENTRFQASPVHP